MLLYLQANKLACHSFINTAGRQGTRGSETNVFIIQGVANDISIIIPASMPLTL